MKIHQQSNEKYRYIKMISFNDYILEKLHISKNTKEVNWDDICEETKEILKKQDIANADWWLSLHEADNELVVIFREKQSLVRYYDICHELYEMVHKKKDGFEYEVKDDKKYYMKIVITVKNA